MTSNQILKMFGTPKNISHSICGANTGSTWTCITWEYGEFPYDRATFTFNGDQKEKPLNNFDIDKKGSSESLPSAFSTENIMKIKQGISSKTIFKIFGPPQDIRQSVCGTKTKKAWNCTTWGYGNFPYETATFTFSGNHDSYILNDFQIKRD